jgi:hypothetical protein
MRDWREARGLCTDDEGVVGLDSWRGWSGNGYGRFGKRPSSMRGMRESMASSERRGNDENNSG